jgi:hypothetical protein
MTRGLMADALSPLRARVPSVVREREILRVAATIPHPTPSAAIELARREVLAWAQRRSGGPLPSAAWDGKGFEYMPGGRTILGARIQVQGADLWALRGDDPDKTIPGRTWTTEVAIGQKAANQAPRISLRLVLSTSEDKPDIEPAVPGLLRQIADRVGLQVGNHAATGEPWFITSDAELDRLIEMLEARDRGLPLVVASGDERDSEPDQPLIDVGLLARTTLGLARVVVVPAARTYGLSDAFGRMRSVFRGAVRVYMPGFTSASDPYDHILFLAEAIRRDAAVVLRNLRRLAATESLRRTRLGHDVIPFAEVRSAALRIEQEANTEAGASKADLLTAAQKRIDAMEVELQEARDQMELSLDEAVTFEERAKAADAQLFGARARIRQLEEQLTARGQILDADVTLPESWGSFADWCDQALIGRVVLASAARKGIKRATLGDIALAARCLLWLAGTCRDRRMNGGGSLANIPIEQGVENSPCGADEFRFEFHGHFLQADWHVKNGGNMRDPIRCLRIYYGWDATTQQIVVADMPAHRRTGAT